MTHRRSMGVVGVGRDKRDRLRRCFELKLTRTSHRLDKQHVENVL